MFPNNETPRDDFKKFSDGQMNIGKNERNMSLLLGAALLAIGLRRCGWACPLMLLGGKMLLLTFFVVTDFITKNQVISSGNAPDLMLI